MTSKMTETRETLLHLARMRDGKDINPFLNTPESYQRIIDYICDEFGYSQEDFPLYTTCPRCNGSQTFGDQICSMCGGAGNDLTPILQPWLDEEEEN